MKTTKEIQQELIKLLPDSQEQVIRRLQKYFPKNSAPYRGAVLQAGRLKELRRKKIQGTITVEEQQIEENKIRAALLDILTALGEETPRASGSPAAWWVWVVAFIVLGGFGALGWHHLNDDADQISPPTDSLGIAALDTIPRGSAQTIPPEKLPRGPVGKILYSVPDRMKLKRKTRCIIRISPAELSTLELTEGIPSEAPIALDSVRIGDVMTARLSNAPDDKAFKVTPLSTPEQVIEPGFFTEWLFEVTPLLPGRHSLYIKITVKVKVEDFGIKEKDIFVMDKEIEILNEAIPAGEPVLKEGGNIVLAGTAPPTTDQPTENTETTETTDKPKAEESKSSDKPLKDIATSEGSGENTSTPQTTTGTPNSSKSNAPTTAKNIENLPARLGGGLEKRAVRYAPPFKAIGKSGTLTLKICVDKKGNVTSVRFSQKGTTFLDLKRQKKAIENSKKWIFAPGKKTECGTITYRFREK
ncbi:MAG: hypothetical protein D6714_00475 [Bacteroidetes bacterium]|nr:MAG: hypothetical protein D6714_00475 [Bacteroidota bacterium]